MRNLPIIMTRFQQNRTLSALLLITSTAVAESQQAPLSANVSGINKSEFSTTERGGNSTVVYQAQFFAPYNPVTANDMLDRIPGLSLDGSDDSDDRGLGTGGNVLINGQRIAGKENSPSDLLGRISAGDVERIEIIRDTSGDLDVRGANQVVNIVLSDSASRSSTQAELILRLNHDDTFEAGASVSLSRQLGKLQALFNLEANPNFENRETRETRFAPDGDVIGTLFETNIRDQDNFRFSNNMSYNSGPHRMQLNTQISDNSYPRPIHRDFVDVVNSETFTRVEEELIDNTEKNWEVGGDYEYRFANNSRLQFLFIANEDVSDSVRERFASPPANPTAELSKNLFIESNEATTERIVQGNYSFALADDQSLRFGLERADTRLDSSLFIGSAGGTEPPSDRFGGLPPIPALNNPGTEVKEIRYEGFAFHNWTLNERMNLESSLVYETSEISQSGAVRQVRDFDFLRPAVDYRFNITDNFQLRASVRRNVSQLSFANFAATANEDDRDRNADAGNPELVPEKEWNYSVEAEYRLPEDAAVFSVSLFHADIEDFIGRINATTDPGIPLSAVGNIGRAERRGMTINASTRLGYWNLPDAIASLEVALSDSNATDPFLGTEQRIDGRGQADFEFRHDVPGLGLSYGMEYHYPFDGGYYEIDVATITRNDNAPYLNLFVSKVFFDDVTFRLESNDTLDDFRCRERQRFNGTTMEGALRLIEDSCSSRFRRLILTVQTVF
ncbi:TonB-dependent receptor plug domain-containing protein [Woeseia oceani]|nr:TonB-dependent receptor [Woeseia oceani]